MSSVKPSIAASSRCIQLYSATNKQYRRVSAAVGTLTASRMQRAHTSTPKLKTRDTTELFSSRYFRCNTSINHWKRIPLRKKKTLVASGTQAFNTRATNTCASTFLKQIQIGLFFSQPVGRDPQGGPQMILGGSPDDSEVTI